MQCVQCKAYELLPRELDEGLIVAQCSRCEGALLSLLNYRFWAQKNYASNVASAEIVEATDPQPVADQTSAKQCPKCNRLMLKFRLSNEVNNRLDFCSFCDEVWLDKHEWLLFKQLQLPVSLPQLLSDGWQRQLRDKQRIQSLHKQYADVLGEEDFEKVLAFKRWLEEHPQKSEIKLFLSMSNSV